MSNPRHGITQFHRPIELKLERWMECVSMYLKRYFVEDMSSVIVMNGDRGFLFATEVIVWTQTVVDDARMMG